MNASCVGGTGKTGWVLSCSHSCFLGAKAEPCWAGSWAVLLLGAGVGHWGWKLGLEPGKQSPWPLSLRPRLKVRVWGNGVVARGPCLAAVSYLGQPWPTCGKESPEKAGPPGSNYPLYDPPWRWVTETYNSPGNWIRPPLAGWPRTLYGDTLGSG